MHQSIHPDANTDRRDTTTAPRAAASATVANSLMRMDWPLPRRLLGVWAHPDGEASLSAGLMARVIDAGGSVTVLAWLPADQRTVCQDQIDLVGRHSVTEPLDTSPARPRRPDR